MANNWILTPPKLLFLPPYTPVFSSEMECSRSHDSEMVQHLYIGCSEGRVPAGGHLTPFWYPRPFLVPTLPGFQYTSVAPFWNRGTKSIPFLKRKWVILGAKKWLMGHLLLEHLKGWPLEGVLQKIFFFLEMPSVGQYTAHINSPACKLTKTQL